MAKRFSVETIFKGIDRITAPIRRMQSGVRKFARNSERWLRGVSRRVDAINRGFKTFGRRMAIGAGVVTAAMTKATLVGADFEQTLVDAGVKFPGMVKKGTEAFGKLEKAALDTAASSRFMVRDTASSLLFMAKAGFDAEGAILSLPQAVDFATATNSELARSTDIATDAMGAFGLESKNAAERAKNFAKVTDVMTLATSRANTDLEQFFDTLKDAGPLATEAGVSIEDTAAIIAVLADSGIKGSRAGTALKNTLLGMAAPSSTAGKLMRRLKVDVADVDGNMRRATDVFKDMLVALDGMSQQDRLKAIKEIFGRRSIAGAIKLIKDQGKKVNALSEEITNATGATQEWAKVQRDTTKGSIDRLKSSVESLGITVFKAAQGPITRAVEATTAWINANKGLIGQKVGAWVKWISDNQEMLISRGLTIMKLIGAWIVFTTVLKTFVLIMTAVNLVMAANPVTLLVLGIMAAVAAVVLLVKNWDRVRKSFKTAPTWIRVLIAALFPILAIIMMIANNWDRVTSAIKAAIREFQRFTGLKDDKTSPESKLKGLGKGLRNKVSPLSESQRMSADLFGGPTPATALGESIAIHRSRQESKTTNEVVIKDETGRAKPVGEMPDAVKVESTGGF